MTIFFAFLPLLRRRKLYFVAAGALLFAPCVVFYPWLSGMFRFWPAITTIPSYLYLLVTEENKSLIFAYLLFPVSLTGLIFWGLACWLVPKTQDPAMPVFSIWPVAGGIVFYLYLRFTYVEPRSEFQVFYLLFPALVTGLIYWGSTYWRRPKK